MGEYLCIKESVCVSTEIQRSKFITYAYPLFADEDAQAHLDALRKEHYSATHVCYAYSFLGNSRFSDDGEPSGTAGLPILGAIKGFDNVLVAVVRYFGGIKLGTGGLARAYRGCAVDCLESAKVVRFLPAKDISTACDYSTYQILADLLKRWQALVLCERFLDRVEVCFSLPESRCGEAITKLDAMQLGFEVVDCVRAF